MNVQSLIDVVFQVSLNFSILSRGENTISISFNNEEESIRCVELLNEYKEEIEVNRVKNDVIVKFK